MHSLSLKFLARSSEQDLVYVHLFRLAHRVGNCPRERFGRNCNLLIELLDALGEVRLGYLFGNSVATAPGEITVVRMLYGFTSWRNPSDMIRTAVCSSPSP
jgi:hypothetical protein